MAVTATCTVVPSGTLAANQKANLQVEISASTDAAQVVQVAPYGYDTSNGADSGPNGVVFFGNSTGPQPTLWVVPAGSALTVTVPFYSVYASSAPGYTYAGAQSTANTVSLGAVVTLSDQTTANASETTVTITAPKLFNGR